MSLSTPYIRIQQRLVDLANDLTETEVAAIVPASPAWSVKDVYAHLAGAATDIVNGNTEGVGSDEWTAAQVDPRRQMTLAAVCEEWSEITPSFVEMVDASGDQLLALVAGNWTHEQDIRGAVGLRGLTSGDGLEVVLRRVDEAADRIKAAGAPALQIITPDRQWTLGPGEAAATLTTTGYELARVISSRRSAGQIAGLDWEGEPTAYIQPLPLSGPCERPLDV